MWVKSGPIVRGAGSVSLCRRERLPGRKCFVTVGKWYFQCERNQLFLHSAMYDRANRFPEKEIQHFLIGSDLLLVKKMLSAVKLKSHRENMEIRS